MTDETYQINFIRILQIPSNEREGFNTSSTVRNKHVKVEEKGKASFDTPCMIQSNAESMKKIMGALYYLPAK